MRVSDQFTEQMERKLRVAVRVRSRYAATMPDPVHTPARRPSTGEVPGLRAMADAHLAAGVRDSRRILSEALAAAQQRAGREAFLARMYMGGALDPRIDEEQLLVEGLLMLELGGLGVVEQDTAVEACVAMLKGWEHRQRLAAGRAA